MTKRLRNILIIAVAAIVLLLTGLFTGALDGVLRQLNIEIAGHPVAVADSSGSSDIVATPVPSKTDSAAATAAPGETVVPVFDLVRVEPTGDAVIAGRSDPEAKVEILSGQDVVADGKANDTGSWAIVLADPLKPGAHDLSVRATGKEGKVETSDQSVAVSVPEGANGDVLVVLNQPGSPSTVLQVPGLEEAQAKLADAGVEPPKAEIPAAAAKPAEPAAPAAETKPAEPAPTVVAEATPAAPAAEAKPTEVAAATTEVKPAEPAPAAVEAKPTEVAAATTEVKPAEPAPAAAPAQPAAAVAPAAEVKAAGDLIAIPTPPADMLATAAAPDLGAAPVETPVKADAATPAAAVETPAAAAPVAAAETPAAAPAAAAPAAPAEVAVATISIDAVELENGNRFYAAGSGANGAVIRVYVDDKAVGDTTVGKGRWLFQGKVELAPGKHSVRVDQIGGDGKVLARAEVPFEIADDVLTAPTLAAGSGTAVAGAGTAGNAGPTEPKTLIIRRGDNLWMIAKRLYGQGIRYSTIYQANTDQIRNPDLIYPGQVFVIPEGDNAWVPVGQ